MNTTKSPAATAHTPGPWGYNTEEHADGASFLISDGELPIARVRISGARPLSELRANARLITAAPEMATELAECRKLLRELRAMHEDAWHRDEKKAVKDRIFAVHAILAKIGGGS